MRYLIIFALLVPILAAQPAKKSEAAPGFAEREKRYRIQPNDVVEVQFRYTPEYNLTATVQPDGYITSQIAGEVKVGGLTLAEAADLVAEQASGRLNNPEVVVSPKDFVKPRFATAGEVNAPGHHELRGDIGIVEAIAMSGGFKDSAKRSQVVLVRRIDGEYAEVRVFDVKKLMDPRHISEQIQIMAGDLIVVPRNRMSKLEPVMRVATLSLYGLSLALIR